MSKPSDAKLQAKIDQGKQMIKDVIAENSETRKMIDDREKAEKVMTSKESTAEKAEKKSDEKAPQYRDEANKVFGKESCQLEGFKDDKKISGGRRFSFA
jgi:hypothetical protein